MSGAGALDGFAAALVDPDRPLPAGLSTWNGSDVRQRFAVYRNNVIVSLINALAARYPVVRMLVGEEFFAGMARVYAASRPPVSVIMAEYGVDFPDFVAVFAPARAVPYLADVARLESARTEAWHAADAPVLRPETFSALDPGDLAGLRLSLHPSTRIIVSPHAIVSLWRAHQQAQPDEEAFAAIDPDQPEDALVVRPHDDVLVYALPPGGAAAFAALQQAVPLGAAIERVAGTPGFDPTDLFTVLLTSGVVSALIPSGDVS